MLGVIGLICLLIALDQGSKWLVCSLIPLYHEKVIIRDFFSLTYVRNRGAAWGLLSMKSWGTIFLSVISFCLSILLLSMILKCKNNLLRLTLAIIFAGSVGNLIDRVFRGYVVDFLLFRFGGWAFPSFNLADSLIVCGSILLFILLLQDHHFHDLIKTLPLSRTRDSGGAG